MPASLHPDRRDRSRGAGMNRRSASFRRAPLVIAAFAIASGALALTATPAFAANQTLKISVTGPGIVSGAGIGCGNGATCETEVEEGTAVTLTANHSERTALSWEGCETENGAECTLTIGAAPAEVKAEFTPIEQQTLTVANPGTGTITATSPGGEFAAIDCGNGATLCTETYNQGTGPIILTATPDERSTTPIVWHGCDTTPSETECEVTMSAAKSVSAEFTAKTQEPLTVLTTEGSGAGTVTGGPGGEFTQIECGGGPTTCTAEYDEGATIILTATRATHSKFTGWTNCTNVISTNEYEPSECEVQMAEAETVKAKFAAIPQQALEVTVEGAGEVTSSPSGIACTATGGTCAEHFDEEGPESTVALTVAASPDNHFKEWLGVSCDESTATICEVTMSTAKSVQAVFAPTLHTLTVTPTGPGSVSAASGAISGCEEHTGTCTGPYQEGSTLTLTAAPAAHNHVTWTGCKAVPSPDECEVEIGPSDSAVRATFSINQHTLTLNRSGAGSVSADRGAISHCSSFGGTCAGTYGEASTVLLTASPHANYSVTWAGCKAVPSTDECEVEIGLSDSAVEVTFAANRHTLTIVPSGLGAVSANSGAISHCSSSAGTCAGPYIEAATLTLTATPASHQAVTWSGCTRSSADTCEVTIGASDMSIGAAFVPLAHALAIATSGSGSGSVTCNGVPCATSYPEGTSLTLTAIPASGSTFAGWSGAGCSGTGACQITLEADTQLTATFNANPPPPVEEKKPPPLKCHKGFVKKNGRCVRKPKPHRHHRKRH